MSICPIFRPAHDFSFRIGASVNHDAFTTIGAPSVLLGPVLYRPPRARLDERGPEEEMAGSGVDEHRKLHPAESVGAAFSGSKPAVVSWRDARYIHDG